MGTNILRIKAAPHPGGPLPGFVLISKLNPYVADFFYSLRSPWVFFEDAEKSPPKTLGHRATKPRKQDTVGHEMIPRMWRGVPVGKPAFPGTYRTSLIKTPATWFFCRYASQKPRIPPPHAPPPPANKNLGRGARLRPWYRAPPLVNARPRGPEPCTERPTPCWICAPPTQQLFCFWRSPAPRPRPLPPRRPNPPFGPCLDRNIFPNVPNSWVTEGLRPAGSKLFAGGPRCPNPSIPRNE